MGNPRPTGDEWICRRCGSIQDGSVSVCTNCGAPSTPDSPLAPSHDGATDRSTLDWTAILLAVLTALVIVVLAVAVTI